jgi:hypothetical protein
MPVDGDDGFYPTGNELVLFYMIYLLNFTQVLGLFTPYMEKKKIFIETRNRKFQSQVSGSCVGVCSIQLSTR